MITLTAGTKGEIILPKKIREAIGIHNGGIITVIVKENSVEISPKNESVVEKMRARAEKYGTDVTKWKMGDEMFEEEFSHVHRR